MQQPYVPPQQAQPQPTQQQPITPQGAPREHNQGPPFNGQQQWNNSGQSLPSGDLSASEARTWSIVAHLANPVASLFSAGWLGFLGPLIVWAIYKDRSPMVRKASAGAFNFSLTLMIGYILLWVVTIITFGLAIFITLPLMFVLWAVSLILHIMAAIKAGNNEDYTYPAQIPVLK
ncbi:DUF4870 domain-containing protein [Ornithinimicrobium sp. INDO-MA30-4]|uniref:DUF4870 domain-containing protein n=1 Tax=Ornithinimicrobium sp. INDO-MA30-4 TaxID=2908651 RepID=UPI001F179ADB|nr:DUF4870 domain-containing protein [Ornithinimicrobium sp. INDO-MA30-4]UJH70883.1 DUF4870 domain-containing protein [Ornithinimicrobium sp. INDO-MA30-4]